MLVGLRVLGAPTPPPPPPPQFGIGFERRGRFRQDFRKVFYLLGVRLMQGGWD